MGVRWSAFVAALALAGNAAAQAQSLDQVEPILAKQCAVWSAAQGADAADRGDDASARAFEGISQYFVGLYEGLTGQSINASRDAEALAYLDMRIGEFDTLCGDLARDFGDRMTAWGATLSAMSEEPAGKGGS